MSWGKGGDNGGPWGRPPGNGGSSGGGRGTGGGGFQPSNDNFDELLKKSQERFKEVFNGDGGNKKMIAVSLLVLGLLWVGSGVYQVQPGEVGVVMRFGEFHRETGAGLRYHLPAPIESVKLVNTQLVRKESFGTQSQSSAFDSAESMQGDESLMLTGDENIIDITFDVQWNISSAQNYLFNVKNAPQTVRNVAASAMREVIGRTTFTRALTEGKSRIEQDTRQLMQETLDSQLPGSYKSGIRILNVNLVEAAAPSQVLEAFRDVQAARADQERLRNEAEAYRNDIIPRARGAAERLLQEAEAYKQQVIAQASGDAARFNSVYSEYKLSPDVTRKRMYLETMERVMSGMNKVIVEDGKGVLPYLPLPALQTKSATKAAEGAQ